MPGAPFHFSFPPPAAPTSLSATATAFNRVELAWTDNADNETGFEIERSTTGNVGTFLPLASLGVDAASFVDNSVVESAEYCYRVRAVNLTGPSAFTAVECATTPAEGETALDLGTGGAYVTFGPAPDLGLAQFTLELWFRRDGAGANANTGTGGFDAVPLLTKGRGEAEGSNVDMNWFLGIRSDGVLAADFEDLAAGVNHPVAGATAVSSGVWHHAAATYDGTTWKLYLDGLLDGEARGRSGAALGQHPARGAGHGDEFDRRGRREIRRRHRRSPRVEPCAEPGRDPRDDQRGACGSPTADLVARWGLNEGSGAVVLDSAPPTVDGTVAGSGYTWVIGAPFDLSFNEAPGAPVVVSPLDLAVGVGLSPNLDVTVSDPESDNLSVTYFGRPAAAAADPDFTIVGLPDTQFYSETYNATFHAQTQWVVDNLAPRNVVFVTQLGDCVQNGDNGGNNVEWLVADAAMSRLEDRRRCSRRASPSAWPWATTTSRPIADPDGTTTFYNQFFGTARFAGRTLLRRPLRLEQRQPLPAVQRGRAGLRHRAPGVRHHAGLRRCWPGPTTCCPRYSSHGGPSW